MSIHGVSETQGISEDDFVRICPSLIRQLQKGACTEEKPGSSEAGEDTGKMSHGKHLNMAYVMLPTRNFLRTCSVTLLEEHLYRRKQFKMQLNIQNSERKRRFEEYLTLLSSRK